jgi:tetratricopeptide (TPR) repeat protein
MKQALGMAIVGLLQAANASAQIPDKFTNLQVFPKDASREEVLGAMRSFSRALGVRCGGCHEYRGQDPGAIENVDFASDAKPEKKTARAMMKMTRAINEDYLAHLESDAGPEGTTAPPRVNVECVTCHRGLSRPETIGAVLARSLAKDGPDAAVHAYRELRTKYLASGSYDFSERPLNELVERLVDEGRGKEALALAQLNVELNPDSGAAQYGLGTALVTSGDRLRGIEALERSLVLEPGNRRARRKLDELKSPASPKP